MIGSDNASRKARRFQMAGLAASVVSAALVAAVGSPSVASSQLDQSPPAPAAAPIEVVSVEPRRVQAPGDAVVRLRFRGVDRDSSISFSLDGAVSDDNFNSGTDGPTVRSLAIKGVTLDGPGELFVPFEDTDDYVTPSCARSGTDIGDDEAKRYTVGVPAMATTDLLVRLSIPKGFRHHLPALEIVASPLEPDPPADAGRALAQFSVLVPIPRGGRSVEALTLDLKRTRTGVLATGSVASGRTGKKVWIVGYGPDTESDPLQVGIPSFPLAPLSGALAPVGSRPSADSEALHLLATTRTKAGKFTAVLNIPTNTSVVARTRAVPGGSRAGASCAYLSP